MTRQAIDIALDMIGRPLLTREVQRAPLPDGVLEVIRLAIANDMELAEAGRVRGRDPNSMRQAAIFFLQQALLFPGADSYRILGLPYGASSNEIREHKRLLLKWLHPDRNPSVWEQLLFQRVIEAAADLQNPSSSFSPIKSNIPVVRRRQPRARRRSVAAYRKQPLPWHTLFWRYFRGVAIAAIVLTVLGSTWPILSGEPILQTIGWNPW